MNKELKRLYTLLLSNDVEIEELTQKVYECGCVVIKIRGNRIGRYHIAPSGEWELSGHAIDAIEFPIRDGDIVLACVKTIRQGCLNYDTIL